MYIKDMFAKPIDRDIKGVIKVGQDDLQNIRQELDEYVVTGELLKHFREFFQNYRKGITGATDKMGVWISGFFGSGKSHFLKILSYLLENRQVDEKPAISFFADGGKISDPAVVADMKLAGEVGADVMLFNIDSKSISGASGAAGTKERIASVFLRVFNEMQGFSGSMPKLADLEKDLSHKGLYGAFQTEFHRISGKEWAASRNQFQFVRDDVIRALTATGAMSEDSARELCSSVRKDEGISIEAFAQQVREYCLSKGDRHHVVFLVDEIGQYIANDTELMLNLQTVTEDLGRFCDGKAWVVVTSQEDIDSATKDMANDFSKIQGRFDTRLSLSSANVDEVIRKRILAKNPAATDALRLLFDEYETILKNILVFSAGTPHKMLYTDRDDFAAVYPFVPYQFKLLGDVLTAIRKNSASGKHLSEGERSMLALFKESAEQFMEQDEYSLIPFDTFYEALHRFIDHTHKTVITHAESNAHLDPFDVRLLKVLFMIKYTESVIKGNVENLTTLLIDSIRADRLALQENVTEGLKRLAGENLIQKNGEIYTFLTDDEQDVNRAIRDIDVDMGEIMADVAEKIFDELLKDTKYRHSARYNFPFNQKIDGVTHKGRGSNEIGLHIVTGYTMESSDAARSISMNGTDAIVYLPADRLSFVDEEREVLRIKKFLLRHHSGESSRHEAIRRAKQNELGDRMKRVTAMIEDAIRYADFFIFGERAEIAQPQAQEMLRGALSLLALQRYNKLGYMKSQPDMRAVEQLLADERTLGLDDSGSGDDHLAEQEILQFLDLSAAQGDRVTMKKLIDKFGRTPYGYNDIDVQWLVVSLLVQNKITLTINAREHGARSASPGDILKYVTKKENIDRCFIQRRKQIPEAHRKAVREVLKEFGVTPPDDRDDEMMELLRKELRNNNEKIGPALAAYDREPRYPGKDVLRSAKTLFDDVLGVEAPSFFYEKINDRRDDMLDALEGIIQPLAFFSNTESGQRRIFDDACRVLDIWDRNKNFIDRPEMEDAVKAIRAVVQKAEPYGDIRRLPELTAQFDSANEMVLMDLRIPAERNLRGYREALIDELNRVKCASADTLRDKIARMFDELEMKCSGALEVTGIKVAESEGETLKGRLMREVADLSAEATNVAPEAEPDVDEFGPHTPEKPRRQKSVSIRSMIRTTRLETPEDVDMFVSDIRKRLLGELGDDTTLIVS